MFSLHSYLDQWLLYVSCRFVNVICVYVGTYVCIGPQSELNICVTILFTLRYSNVIKAVLIMF